MWIARDEIGTIYLYSVKPKKGVASWHVSDGSMYCALDKETFFPEVKWEDDEPKEIILKTPGEGEDKVLSELSKIREMLQEVLDYVRNERDLKNTGANDFRDFLVNIAANLAANNMGNNKQ